MKNNKIIIFLILAIGFIAIFGYFIFTKNNKQETITENAPNFLSQDNILSKNDFSPQVDGQGGISFTVTPLGFVSEEPIKFEIAIDTHSGSLDFDLTEISILEDDKGNKYQPLDWEGPGPGGHHISGTLVFPEIDNQTKTIKLTIQDTYPRIFEWEL